MVLSLDPARFDDTITPPAQITAAEFREKVVLADGGVYDNLGLETTWKHNKTVLVSDAGGALLNECDPAQDWLGQVDRILNVTYRQVVTLRKRSFIQLFKLGVRDGAYWGIGSDLASYQLPNALVCPPGVTAELAATPTRLTSTADPLQAQLIDWGYAVCDAGMRRWVVKDAPAPAQSPYGTFKKS